MTLTMVAKPTNSRTTGEYKVHDLENIGDTDLTFVTVEFLDSPNKPLPVPRSVR